MIKIFCDECGKEITDQDYVEQSILVNYDIEQSINVAVCKNCWNNTPTVDGEKINKTGGTSNGK